MAQRFISSMPHGSTMPYYWNVSESRFDNELQQAANTNQSAYDADENDLANAIQYAKEHNYLPSFIADIELIEFEP
jgi:maltose-binding protein MalE